jgi:hypothetical protein
MVPSKRAEKPLYLEVSRLTLDEVDVGFGVTRVRQGEKPGEREYAYQSTTLLPVSESEIAIEDSYNVIQLDAKRRMKRGVWVDASGGEISMQIVVNRSPDGAYGYEGQISGKAVQGPLATPEGFATPVDTAALMKQRLSGKKPFSEVLQEYHPSLDPTALIPVTYSREAAAAPREVLVKLGEQILTTRMDEHGLAEIARLPVGSHVLSIQREHREGRF